MIKNKLPEFVVLSSRKEFETLKFMVKCWAIVGLIILAATVLD